MSPSFHAPCLGRSAFSLLELLVVLAVVSSLTLLVTPAVSTLSRSYQLASAAQMITGQFAFARQQAMTRGASVQVRIYLLPDVQGSSFSYRAIQCFIEGEPVASGSAQLTALEKPQMFNLPVQVLSDSIKSSLLTLPATTNPELPLANYQRNYAYVSFRFRPNGRTDLPDTATGLTLVLNGDRLGSSGVPSNFRSIEIDPCSGVIRRYEP